MNSQIAKPQNQVDHGISLFVHVAIGFIAKLMQIWTSIIQIFSLDRKPKRNNKGVRYSGHLRGENDFFEENAFYSLFEHIELFEKTYGHKDNPLFN